MWNVGFADGVSNSRPSPPGDFMPESSHSEYWSGYRSGVRAQKKDRKEQYEEYVGNDKNPRPVRR